MYINYADLFEKLDTKLATLEPPPGDDPGILHGVQELSLRRNMSVCKEASKTAPPNLRLTAIENYLTKYIALLHQYIKYETKLGIPLEGDSVAGKVGFLWNSPVSDLPKNAHFSLNSILLEEIMTLVTYAALLQDQAQEMCNTLLAGSQLADSPDKKPTTTTTNSETSSSPVDALAAASLFRKAAGVYAYIRKQLLPPALSHMPSDAPCELTAAALDCLETLTLARAQGVAAYRAEAKSASASTLAAVHMGAVQLWEAAALKARSGPGRPASQRLQRYIAVSSGLHEAKALRSLASICRDDHQLGEAVACLKAASGKVSQCLVVAEKDEEWKPAFRTELAVIDSVLKVYDRERELVHMQPVPGVIRALPQGKGIVSTAEWEPPVCEDHYFSID